MPVLSSGDPCPLSPAPPLPLMKRATLTRLCMALRKRRAEEAAAPAPPVRFPVRRRRPCGEPFPGQPGTQRPETPTGDPDRSLNHPASPSPSLQPPAPPRPEHLGHPERLRVARQGARPGAPAATPGPWRWPCKRAPPPQPSPYPLHALQVPLQQAVQREGDDVVHVLNLKDKTREGAQSPAAQRGRARVPAPSPQPSSEDDPRPLPQMPASSPASTAVTSCD